MIPEEKAQAAIAAFWKKNAEREYLGNRYWTLNHEAERSALFDAMIEAVRAAERSAWQERERVLTEALEKIERAVMPKDLIAITARAALNLQVVDKEQR